jgi:acyl dehydratase
MSEAAARAFEHFKADVGTDEGTGAWFQVTQDQIDQFADVTHDHQFIHVDPERAKDTPFGTTIAHGFLTLSMLTHLADGASSAPADPARYEGVLMGINYHAELHRRDRRRGEAGARGRVGHPHRLRVTHAGRRRA